MRHYKMAAEASDLAYLSLERKMNEEIKTRNASIKDLEKTIKRQQGAAKEGNQAITKFAGLEAEIKTKDSNIIQLNDELNKIKQEKSLVEVELKCAIEKLDDQAIRLAFLQNDPMDEGGEDKASEEATEENKADSNAATNAATEEARGSGKPDAKEVAKEAEVTKSSTVPWVEIPVKELRRVEVAFVDKSKECEHADEKAEVLKGALLYTIKYYNPKYLLPEEYEKELRMMQSLSNLAGYAKGAIGLSAQQLKELQQQAALGRDFLSAVQLDP